MKENNNDKESRIVHLREDYRQKDLKIKVFMNEMAELIQVHENNNKLYI